MTLNELFVKRGIVCAHIIDDAFDILPSYAMGPEEAQAALENIEEEDFNDICAILNLKSCDEDGIRESLQDIQSIHMLFKNRASIKEKASKILFDSFDKEAAGKVALIQPLLNLLKDNGVHCHCFGVDYLPEGVEAPQLLFIDLKLKEGAKSDLTHVDAVKVFKSLLTVHKDCKPFVFLMSSLKTVLPEKRELFRRDAELFQSEFEDLDKAIFTNGDELSRVLGSYTQSLELLSDLRDKMKAFQGGIEEAAKKVMTQLRALDLADYFVLYHNTIAIEKIKLGSYVVEMLLEYLAHEVEGQAEVWDLARSLDQLELTKLPRARFGVTHAVSRLYSANMMHSEAMLRAEEEAKEGPAQGYFFTGDIFVDAQAYNLPIPERVYAIVTPACDLVRPEKMNERTLLLCEGSVRAVNPGSSTLIAQDNLPITVMNNLRNKDQFIAIEWNKKKLHTWHEAERLKFSDPSQCSRVRVGRLRPTYALQLQRAITSDLSRVGTQRPPSALVPHQLRCFVSDSKKWHEVYFDPNTDAAALTDSESNGKKYTLFVLTDSTIHKAFIKISEWINNNPNAVNRISIEKVLGENVRNALRGYKQKVPQNKKPNDKVDVTAYPLVDGTEVEQKLVAITRAHSGSMYSQIADGHDVKKCQNACVVFKLEVPLEPTEQVVTQNPA